MNKYQSLVICQKINSKIKEKQKSKRPKTPVLMYTEYI
jgi:hypothetical protein